MTRVSSREKLELLEKRKWMEERLPHRYLHKLYSWQRDYLNTQNRYSFLVAANQIGKAQPLQALIATPSGFKKMGDIRVGDSVYGSDGSVCRVVDIPYVGIGECYKITFDDGSSTIVHENHEWKCKTSKQRFCKNYRNGNRVWDNPEYDEWVVLSTKEIVDSGGYSPFTSAYKRVSIPVSNPVDYADKDLFDPYLIGLLLGDGGLTEGSVILTSGVPEITEYISKYDVVETGDRGHRIRGLRGIIDGILGRCNSYEKFIPDEYLTDCVDSRKALLAGLMDTDGYISRSGALSYCTTSSKLRDGFIELLNSLGGVVNSVRTRKPFYYKDGVKVFCSDAYDIGFRIGFNPFRISKKADRFKVNKRYRLERIIYSIEYVGRLQTKCISVNSIDNTYLCEKSYIVTHNSTVGIIRNIEWATNKALWPELWPGKDPTDGVFWYLYPGLDFASVEFETKWKKYLPKAELKDDPVYGWKHRYRNQNIDMIEFNSGIKLLFRSYGQNVSNLQGNTCYSVTSDEEIPYEMFSEVNSRLNATQGYFSMVFTATLGQEEWRRTMEEKGEMELFPHAWKRNVSLYDCMLYEDGSPGQYTEESIRAIKNSYPTEREVQKRVYGRFVKAEGLIYESFQSKRNVVKPIEVPKDWYIYSGVDWGSGGESGHPSAISFIAVRPDMRKGCLFRFWRGDGISTTQNDLVDKYVELRGSLNVMTQYYDWAARDFYQHAISRGEHFEQAEKSHEIGQGLLNSLFKNQMLDIFESDESWKLVNELERLSHDTPKRRATDDGIDSLRYACSKIPWDFSHISGEKEIKVDKRTEREKRLHMMQFDTSDDALEEIEFWDSYINDWG